MFKRKFAIITIVEIIIIVVVLLDLFVIPKEVEVRLENWQTEANLPVIGKNEDYDAVFLGTSHGRIFSRFKNHDRVEKILGKNFINLSQGGERGGVNSLQSYLLYFYMRDNSAKTLAYFVDPFSFYHKTLDDNPKIYINEPYRKDFYNLLVDQQTDKAIIDFYKTKDEKGIKPIEYPEFNKDIEDTKVATLEGKALVDRINYLYTDAYNREEFEKTLQTLLETIRIAQNHGTRVVVIVPTTQFPEQLGDRFVLDALKEHASKSRYEYYNYSTAITDPALYYDTDHLNTEGVLLFSEKYLKPILDK